MDSTKDLPVALKTVGASAMAGLWRINLTPIDTLKTMMQVEGASGVTSLKTKVKLGGPTVLYHGALASAGATFVGHYPWFFTYNTLNEWLPQTDVTHLKLLRSAVMGFSASLVSDTCSNSIRVVKTSKQTATVAVTYPQVVKDILAKEGAMGLFGRGLKTRLLANGVQGIMFTVLWRLFQEKMGF